ncbi:Acyl-CoA reductase or other NAD-dependent aldehyde dehydrogenase [Geosmithia morbida]|uniref:aldehyde dehydrogenase (NAD(+)) n=1 Tax=Geosmithia morbida TaxID=1094350 RepID=A0A9P4YN52_9HYPO|nr:Acyl-CoA reductase or other NAD-dependent aldehyde dehydrogenase [Geosmithia morbida]KAF4120021.1 Acyl-CoA reductase or other NAD-dependent aldehyde dehydrogenase [Geosmithia morbida]
MTPPTYQLWVGGKYIDGSGERIAVENPATGEMIAECHTASDVDVDNAVITAHSTFKSGVWSRCSRHERADVLERAADCLTQEMQSLISLEVAQTGRAVREMQAQVPSLVRWFKYYAAVLRTEERPVLPTSGKLHNWVERVALGVVVQITPFNHPLLIAVKKLAPALAAGNSVIVKPSELTPLTTVLLGPILQRAGLPNGVFNVVPGLGATTGKRLVGSPLVRKVDVTGGTAAGRAIGSIVGGNLARYTAELGGKAPVIVFEQANLDAAVNGIAFGAFVASGQTCVAATRIIVQKSIIGPLVDKLRCKAQSITDRMGSPSNPSSTMGPLVSAKQLAHVERLVDQAKASLHSTTVCGGQRLSGTSALDGYDFTRGYYYPATILASAGTQGENTILRTDIWKEEAFGPVVVVAGFDTEQEAIELANDSQFGLGAAIWTTDLSQAHRVSKAVESGIVWVNTHHRNDPSSPWGSATSASGVGSENGVEAYHAYTTTKSTIINYASAEEAISTEDWFRQGSGQVRYG